MLCLLPAIVFCLFFFFKPMQKKKNLMWQSPLASPLSSRRLVSTNLHAILNAALSSGSSRTSNARLTRSGGRSRHIFFVIFFLGSGDDDGEKAKVDAKVKKK